MYNQPFYPGLNQYNSQQGYVPSSPTYANQPYTQSNPQPSNTNTAALMAQQVAMHGARPNPDHTDYMKHDMSQNTLQSSARAGFVRKVYTLLTLQLLLTICVGYFAYNSPIFQKVFINLPAIIIVSVLLIAASCAIACAYEALKPCMLPFFIAFTVLFAILVGISICHYKSKIILMAVAATFLLVVLLTAYACITDSDLTGCGPYLCILSGILFIFGIVCIFWRDPIVQLIYSCLSALLFSVYLVFDTQMVLGKHQYQYTLDDAYLAAIQLYIDIIELFLNLLRILSYVNN